MAKSYQLVAWTEKGQVRMIPSQFNDYLNEELQHINQLGERVRYGTYYEVHDLLVLSSAFEKLALSVLNMGKQQAPADLRFRHLSGQGLRDRVERHLWRLPGSQPLQQSPELRQKRSLSPPE